MNFDFFVHRLAQTVKAMISAGILLTYALQFYIVIDVMWPTVNSTLGPFKFPILAECTFRSSLVLVTCKYYEFSMYVLINFTNIYLVLNILVV